MPIARSLKRMMLHTLSFDEVSSPDVNPNAPSGASTAAPVIGVWVFGAAVGYCRWMIVFSRKGLILLPVRRRDLLPPLIAVVLCAEVLEVCWLKLIYVALCWLISCWFMLFLFWLMLNYEKKKRCANKQSENIAYGLYVLFDILAPHGRFRGAFWRPLDFEGGLQFHHFCKKSS